MDALNKQPNKCWHPPHLPLRSRSIPQMRPLLWEHGKFSPDILPSPRAVASGGGAWRLPGRLSHASPVLQGPVAEAS